MELQLVCLCRIGDLEKIKELFRKYPDTNVHHRSEYPFIEACLYGHLELAQWLKQEFPNIDHHTGNDWVYKMTTNPEILKWLESECYTPHHHIKACMY